MKVIINPKKNNCEVRSRNYSSLEMSFEEERRSNGNRANNLTVRYIDTRPRPREMETDLRERERFERSRMEREREERERQAR